MSGLAPPKGRVDERQIMGLVLKAIKIGDKAAERLGYDPESAIAGCAFHHAIDLMAHARGLRTTTRCLPGYQREPVELEVEDLLREEGLL